MMGEFDRLRSVYKEWQDINQLEGETWEHYRVRYNRMLAKLQSQTNADLENILKVIDRVESAEKDQARMRGVHKALIDRVKAFAGQLSAWGYDDPANQVIEEILGEKVNAPDYYALQAENERMRKAFEKIVAGYDHFSYYYAWEIARKFLKDYREENEE